MTGALVLQVIVVGCPGRPHLSPGWYSSKKSVLNSWHFNVGDAAAGSTLGGSRRPLSTPATAPMTSSDVSGLLRAHDDAGGADVDDVAVADDGLPAGDPIDARAIG